VRERENLEEFQEISGKMHDASITNALQSALYLPVVLTLGRLATGMALAIGGFDVARGIVETSPAASITLGTLLAFVTFARQFFEPIQNLAHWFAEMQMAQASAERVLSLVETKPEVQDSPAVRARLEEVATRDPRDGEAEDGFQQQINAIEFQDVGFKYQNGETVLSNFNLSIRGGETFALVGSTGGGKTTIVNLLCQFYEPTSGRILIDGVDYRERGLHWLQSQLGIVLQTPHLFSGTVVDNIRYGKRGASDAEIVEAAKLARAHDFIENLTGGYDFDVGEGGNLLSTGQKQLVSFARALLARPQILVMDEATSSIDSAPWALWRATRTVSRSLSSASPGRPSFSAI